MVSKAAAKQAARAGQRPQKLRAVRGSGLHSDATNLDRLIHERMRLGIMSALAGNETLSFKELKALLNTTDGNVSVHARKLEDAHYISCNKSFEDRMPKTEYRITPSGRKALGRYLKHMEALIRATRNQ